MEDSAGNPTAGNVDNSASQSLTDIQSYLENFNKEIGGNVTEVSQEGEGQAMQVSQVIPADPLPQIQAGQVAPLVTEQGDGQQPLPNVITQQSETQQFNQNFEVTSFAQPQQLIQGQVYYQSPGGQTFYTTSQGDFQNFTGIPEGYQAVQTVPNNGQRPQGQQNEDHVPMEMISVIDKSQPQAESTAPTKTVAASSMPILQSQLTQRQGQRSLLVSRPAPKVVPQIIVQTTAPSGTAQKHIVDVGDSSLKLLADVSGQNVSVETPEGGSADTSTASETPAPELSDAVVMKSGTQYQTLTIVPSDINTVGDVSYVLIVTPDEENKSKDPSVYDFKEKEDGEKEEGTEGRKLKQMTPKKQSPNLMCTYCNYTNPKRYLLSRHMKSHSEERPHKCHICERSFRTSASLQNHINVHTGTKPYKCKDCPSEFTTSGELVRHQRYRHTFIKPHKCPDCDYASVELSKLKRHIRSHTGERPYACPHCSYASPDTYKLKRHLRIHTGEKPYECDVCHARFTQSNSLKAHKLIHSGNKPAFPCDLCPATCGRKTDLKIHIQKLHTSDKPLLCKKCTKSFPDRYSYKIHLKTHEGEKCYKCILCPYAALSTQHLEQHMRQVHMHTELKVDKKHQCPDCDLKFVHKPNLLKHMVEHGHEISEGADLDAPPEPAEGFTEQIEEEQLDASQQETTTFVTEHGQILHVVTNQSTQHADNEQVVYLQLEAVDEGNSQTQVQVLQVADPETSVADGTTITTNTSHITPNTLEVMENTSVVTSDNFVITSNNWENIQEGVEIQPDIETSSVTGETVTVTEEISLPTVRQTRSRKRAASELSEGPQSPKKSKSMEIFTKTPKQTSESVAEGKGGDCLVLGVNDGASSSESTESGQAQGSSPNT